MTQSRFIKHEGDKWVVYSEDGKVLGKHDTEADAETQLAAVEASKAKDAKAARETGYGTVGAEMSSQGRSLAPLMPEFRSFTTEVRLLGDDGSEGAKPKVRGYAAVFNSRSEVMKTEKGDRFVETIRPGAFKRSLEGADVRALIDHDPARLLGRRSSGTLRLGEDDYGLWYEVDPPNASYARDLRESLKRGDISGSSFSFATVDDAWNELEGGILHRELREAHVFDVGPVAFPAYRSTIASFRSLDQFREAREAARQAPGELFQRLNQLRILGLA
jgi:uncharacterized protein